MVGGLVLSGSFGGRSSGGGGGAVGKSTGSSVGGPETTLTNCGSAASCG